MRTKIYLLLIALATTIGSVWGQTVGETFLYGGVKYEITKDVAPLEVMVVRNNYQYHTIVIPESVTDPNGNSYNVTRIEQFAFHQSDNLVSVVLPESIEHIGMFAFADSPNLTSVTFPSTITEMERGILSYCYNIKAVTLPEGMTVIDDRFFQETAITSIKIPASVTTIHRAAFNECKDLASITVAETSTSFSSENGILYNNDKTKIVLFPSGKTDMTVLNMPATVEGAYFTADFSIPDYFNTFNNKTLERIAGGNPTEITIEDGVLYSSSGTKTLLFCPMGRTGTFTVSADVLALSSTAFKGGSLEKIVIHKDVNSISRVNNEGETFSFGSNLREIVVHEDNSNYYTENGILFDSSAKEKLLAYPGGKQEPTYTLDANVTAITHNAFAGNSTLIHFVGNDVLNHIGYHAFDYAESLKTVTSIDNVNVISAYAFRRSGLESIDLPTNPLFTTLGLVGAGGVFERCFNLTSIEIPANIKTIIGNAFSGCENLINVVLNEGLESIDSQAFGNTAISSITIPSTVTHIGDRAFQNSTDLQEIRFSGSALPVLDGNEVFYNISNDAHFIFENAGETTIDTWISANESKLVNINGDALAVGFFTVTFDYNDGSTRQVTTAANYKTGLVKEPETPTRSGYTFEGWFATGTTEAWNFATNTVLADITLTAHLSEIPYTPPTPTYTVTITPLAGVTASPSGTVKEGFSFAFDAYSTRSGYTLKVFVDGSEISAASGTRYLISNVMGNKVVTFELVAGGSSTTPPEDPAPNPGDPTDPGVDPVIPGPGTPGGPGQIIIDENTPSEIPGEFPGDGQIIVRPPLVDPNDPTPPKVIIDGKEVEGEWKTDEDGNPVFVIDLDGLEDGKHTIIINDKEFEFTVDKNARPTSNDVLSTATVTAGYGSITIDTPTSATVSVVSFSGSVVYNAKVTGTVTVNVPSGIYVVVVDRTVTKVVVR